MANPFVVAFCTRGEPRSAAAVAAAHAQQRAAIEKAEAARRHLRGNLTDWRQVPSFREIGYPIIEMKPDGTFAVTKHKRIGGLVCAKSVKENVFISFLKRL